MLPREIVAQKHDRAIRRLVGTGDDFLFLGDEAADRFGIKLALALEVAVEAASRHAGAGHDVVDRSRGETMAVEELQRALDDFLPHLFAVMKLDTHLTPASMLDCHSARYVHQHRSVCSWSWRS